MKKIVFINIIIFLILFFVPFLINSGTLINFLIMVLFYSVLGQSWNILAGYGGQFSFGHAAYFGTGAYMASVAQLSLGLNAWLAFGLSGLAGMVVGLATGFLSFRFKLRGAYFALITLAFAEVLRILASSLSITGGGVGLLIELDRRPANFQFAEPAGYYFLALGLLGLAIGVTAWLERSRFGSALVAVREDEEAAEALGVSAFAVKMKAIALSAALGGLAGGFYTQYFLYIDPTIAYGPAVSVEALFTALVGGAGTLFGPVLGAVLLESVKEGVRHLAGDAPGLDLIVFGSLLILFVRFAPDGLTGTLARVARHWRSAER